MLFAESLGVVAELERQSLGTRALITWRQASSAGLGDGTVARLCAAGRWVRKGRGVYAVAAVDGGPLQDAAVALLVAGRQAFLQRRTAELVLGGMDLEWDGCVDVGVPARSNKRYERRRVPDRHIIEVDGLRTTDGLQTLLDLAKVLDDTEWEWALEAAVRRTPVKGKGRLEPLTSTAALEAALAAPGRKDRASVARVERVLDRRGRSVPPTDSLLETRFIQLGRRFAVPVPLRQVEVVTAGGFTVYVDVAWPELGLFIELDGEGHKDQPTYDSRRVSAIVAATSWMHARFGWTEVVRNPTPTGRRLVAVIESARRRPLPA